MCKIWCLRVVTHVVVAILASLIGIWYTKCQEPVARYILVYPQQAQSTLPPPKDAEVWELVVVPDGALSGDDLEDFVRAQSCLSLGNWEYIGNGSTKGIPRGLLPAPFRDFSDGKVFVFKFPQKQKALVAQ